MADETTSMVTEETYPGLLTSHRKDVGTIQFDLANIKHQVILGMPWLLDHNPIID